MYVGFSDLLLEVIFEFLKNMFLVMDIVEIFYSVDVWGGGFLVFWEIIWECIDCFLFYL